MLKKIKITGNVMIGGKARKPGDIVEVRHFLAQDLIYRNKAEVYSGQPAQNEQKAPKIKGQEESSQPEEKQPEKEPENEESENPEDEEEKDLAEYAREELEEVARDLGLKFPNNIKDATLQKKIEEVLEEQGE